jgi:hypothetical protein
MTKFAAAATLAGALVAGAAMPVQAAEGRNTAAAIGFGAGALAGYAIANANNNYYYGPGYAYSPGYAYAPRHTYAPGYAYAPAPGPVYVEPGYGAYAYAPAPRYRNYNCAGDGGYGKSQSFAACY